MPWVKYLKNWNRTIKGKMIASNLLLFILTVISISAFVLVQTRQSLELAAIDSLELSRKLKEDSLRMWISEIKADMIWLSRMKSLNHQVSNLLSPETEQVSKSDIAKQITSELNTLKAIKRDWQEAFILSGEGEIVISTSAERLGDFRTMDKYFLKGKEHLFLQKVYPSPITFGPTMTISAPIRNDLSETIAVIALHIDLLRMDEIIFESGNDHDESESYLVDRFGALISGKHFGHPDYKKGVSSFGVESAIGGASGTSHYLSFDGNDVIGSYTWIDEIDTGLIVELSKRIAFQPLANVTINILIFSVFILSLLTALIYLFAGQISNPIHRVTRMTRRIAKGNFNTKLEVKSKDETGVLAQSVNKMSDNLQQLMEELSDAKNRAEAATVAKSNFLANMSHEIRTPMNSVLGYAQLISRNPNLDEQSQEYTERIQLSGKHLMELINTILDLSKIESGSSELNEISFDLRELCKELSSMFEFRCKEKSLDWSIECNFDNAVVFADKLKLQQILINLINNAIKFTDSGLIKLKVTRLPPAQFTFEVIDTGRGISEEGLNKIFKPFHQQRESDQLVGSGLGLTIASNLIKDMGDEIHVDSEKNKGSRFWFSLNLALEEVSSGQEQTSNQFKTEVGTALVVDDIADNREVIKYFLQELDYEVLEAENGQEALNILEDMKALKQNVSVVFLDILMPIMSGEEAFCQIQQLGLSPKPKVFAISASTLSHEREQIINLGFDGFLAKPVSFSDITEILRLGPLVNDKEVNETDLEISNSLSVVPEKLINQAIEASKVYHISKLTECINEIERLGSDSQKLTQEKRLADTLRGYLKDLNMEAIEKTLEKIILDRERVE